MLAHPPGRTPRLFLDRFAHPDGRARLVVVRPRSLDRGPGPGSTLVLTTGRLLEHYQSGTQTRRVASLDATSPEARLQIHPVTADGHGIVENDLVEVSSPAGSVHARAALSTAIRPDTVFLPFHFAGTQTANRAVGAHTDPISGMPEFKAIPVTVRRVQEVS